MDNIEIPEERGCWRKEKVLGAGGFGYVILWQNKETNETIALKQCRWGHDTLMTPKHRSRWKLEVDIMFRLDHPNVVKAFNVPKELDVPATELPLLAMEYCRGGDLRKMLNKPENCCGLQQNHIRLLLRHVSSAVNYLHSMRIIHRDLKPENIVIQDSNGSMVFKLIDLGYAKELDQGSLCTSFVGTLQYLAPELFMSQKYSCTVDYWSLGLVTHEVITGLRPFLSDKSPAEWIPIVKNKSPSQIRAYLDEDKNIVFSQEISPHHRICRVLKKDIESWLQIMLEFDPKKRGRHNDISAFVLLEEILNKKVLYIFCIKSLKVLSFPLDTMCSIDDLQKFLKAETGIPVNEQEIILPKGTNPCAEKGISQFLPSNEDDEVGAYLFTKDDNFIPLLPGTEIPPVVESMMRNPRVEVKYPEQRTAWAQAVFLSQQEHTTVGRLIRAFRVNLMNVITEVSQCHKTTSKMTAEMNKVVAKSSFLKSSLEQDIVSYETQADCGGFTSQLMFDSWKSSYENLKKIELLKQKVTSLEEQSSAIHLQTVDLQRTSYARSKLTNPMEEIHSKILEAYNNLKKRSKDQRHVPHNNTDIVRLLCLSLQQSRSSVQDIGLLIRQTNKIKKSIEEVIPQITNILQEINGWDSQICNWQFKRQREMWKVIDALVNKIHGLEYTSTPLLLSSSPQPSHRASTPNNPIFQNGHGLSSSPKNISPPIIPVPTYNTKIEPLSSGTAYLSGFEKSKSTPGTSLTGTLFPPLGTSLASFLEQTLEDTYRVKQENADLIESFQQMMNMLKNDHVSEKPSEKD